MDISVIKTSDGSPTLFNAALNEHYHSIHGALTESLHVFIQHGFLPALAFQYNTLRILEVGFGTGLNAILTASESDIKQQKVEYIGLEPFPVPAELLLQLKYETVLNEKQQSYFEKIHQAPWEEETEIHTNFHIKKWQTGIKDFQDNAKFQLIYFDAFAPEKQPDMWELGVLEKCYQFMEDGGIFITYCAKGQFKRDLKQCGFHVEGKPGPPFKREITFATK